MKAWNHGWWLVMLVYLPPCPWESDRVVALRGDNLLYLASSTCPTGALRKVRQLPRACLREACILPEGEGGWNGLTLLACHSAFYQHPFPSNPHFYIKSDYLLMMPFIRVFVYYLPLFLKIEARWKPKSCVIHCRGPAPSSGTCCWVGIK